MDDLAKNEVVQALFLGLKINGVRVPHSRYAPPVSEEPEVIIDKWQILTVEDGRRLRGEVDRERRLTTLLAGFDLEKMLVVTASGRRYWLRGAPHGAIRREQENEQNKLTEGRRDDKS